MTKIALAAHTTRMDLFISSHPHVVPPHLKKQITEPKYYWYYSRLERSSGRHASPYKTLKTEQVYDLKNHLNESERTEQIMTLLIQSSATKEKGPMVGTKNRVKKHKKVAGKS